MDLRDLYGAMTRLIIRKTFAFWQFFGFHVSPNNFYEPIPDTRQLSDNLWSKKSKAVGINFNTVKQIKLLKLFLARYKDEYDSFPDHKTAVPHEYYLKNGEFESVDAEILYSMVRHFKPKTMIEIGSGFSTQISAQAMLMNNKEDKKHPHKADPLYADKSKLIAVEPYPKKRLPHKIPGLTKVIAKNVQDVPLKEFAKLKADDILFIDSSHVLAIGSDVKYEYLEILPSLRKGVIIHIHDIFFPQEYPKKWIFEFRKFWNEQYLVQAFLMFNPNFEIIWSGAHMHAKQKNLLARAFRSYDPNKTPGSLWIRKIK